MVDPRLVADEGQRPGLGFVVNPICGDLLVAITKLRGLETKLNVTDGLDLWNPGECFCGHVFSGREPLRPLKNSAAVDGGPDLAARFEVTGNLLGSTLFGGTGISLGDGLRVQIAAGAIARAVANVDGLLDHHLMAAGAA